MSSVGYKTDLHKQTHSIYSNKQLGKFTSANTRTSTPCNGVGSELASCRRAQIKMCSSRCTDPLLKVPPYCHREEEKNQCRLPVGAVPHRIVCSFPSLHRLLLVASGSGSVPLVFAAPFPGQRSNASV
ncbi:hypothetical protein JTE90_000059 [Oedothorax gibbosus]|uniref:Uncharacterized protein n=1 Tax=Oedothorax gibbosus TaxID=931172 RepID=A0AAV6UDX5_9ARAC|nr:hypothetical protein JTE90_000059 [Oedothorax gibbosus]